MAFIGQKPERALRQFSECSGTLAPDTFVPLIAQKAATPPQENLLSCVCHRYLFIKMTRTLTYHLTRTSGPPSNAGQEKICG